MPPRMRRSCAKGLHRNDPVLLTLPTHNCCTPYLLPVSCPHQLRKHLRDKLAVATANTHGYGLDGVSSQGATVADATAPQQGQSTA